MHWVKNLLHESCSRQADCPAGSDSLERVAMAIVAADKKARDAWLPRSCRSSTRSRLKLCSEQLKYSWYAGQCSANASGPRSSMRPGAGTGASGYGEWQKSRRNDRRGSSRHAAHGRFVHHRPDLCGTAISARLAESGLCVLAACAVLAIGGAVYFWYLWFLTAKTCIDNVFIVGNNKDRPSFTPSLPFVAVYSHPSRHLVVFGVDPGPAVYASGVRGNRNTIDISARWLVSTSGVPTTAFSSRTALRRSASFRPARHAIELCWRPCSNCQVHRTLPPRPAAIAWGTRSPPSSRNRVERIWRFPRIRT